MDIRYKIAHHLAKIPFIRESVINNADLSAFKEKLPFRIFVRNITGIFMILFSYVIGWPLIFLLGIISIYVKEPLVVVIGGPVAYGISHAVFLAGMFIAGAYYAMILLRWAARVAVTNLLGKKRIDRAIKQSAVSGLTNERPQ